MCSKPRSLPFRLKLQDKQLGLFHRLGGFVSLLFVLCTGVVARQELSLLLLQFHGTQECKPGCVPEPGSLAKAICWEAGTETRTPHIKIRAPDAYTSSPLGDTGALECSRGRAQREGPPSEISGEGSSRPLGVCLIRSLPLRPQI